LKHEELYAGTESKADPPASGRYEIRVAGRLSARWAAHFSGMAMTAEATGMTLLEGPVEDQAALHALLRKVRDLGLDLVSVTRRLPE
jgi:hypothetical protein